MKRSILKSEWQVSRIKILLPVFVCFILVVATVLLVNNQIESEQKLVYQHTDTATEQVCIRIEDFIESRLSAVEVLAELWVQHPDFNKKRFLQFAELYYLNYPGFQAINWVDPKGIIRWVYPEKSNSGAIGKDIHDYSDPERRESFARVEKKQEYGITPCMKLFQGGKGFAIDLPLIYKGKLQGYISGVFQVKTLIEICLARGVFDDFWLEIYEGKEIICRHRPDNDGDKSRKWFVEKKISFRDKTWRIKMEPKLKLYSTATLAGNLPLVFFGLLISFCMGVLVYFLIQKIVLYQDSLEELKDAEKSLVESEKCYRTMIENANDMIWMLDTKGNFTFFNQQSEKVSGYKLQSEEGQSFVPMIHPDDLEMVNEVFQKTLSGESQQYLVKIYDKKDEILFLSVNTAPIYEKDRIVGTVSFGRDITAQLQVERKLEKSFERLKKTTEGIVHAMALTVEMKDPYTAGHQRRVAKIACAIANEMHLSKKRIEGIRIAAILHDIGKILIPSDILNKPGRLNNAEMDRIKTHPQIGADILKTIEFGFPVADIVLQHHERVNKTGYPQNLDGKDIMLEGKIVAVADVVEAMSSARPYRPAYSIEKALKEISENKGILYDPLVVDACIKLFTEKNFTFA